MKKIIDYLRGFSYDFDKNGEKKLLQDLKKFKLQTFFDVGSNVGDYAKIVKSMFPNSQIHCFELSPTTFLTLQARLKNDTSIHLNNYELSNKKETVK